MLGEKLASQDLKLGTTTMIELQIGQRYNVTCCDRKWGTQDYGIWTFTGAFSCRLWFEDDNDAGLSIPKDPAIMAPAYPWMLELAEDTLGESE
jgi:hypothetical protein